jgi:iodotyrosine deiodinase
MVRARFAPLSTYRELSPEEMLQAADDFLSVMRRRRTVRDFSDRPVPKDVLERCLLAAGTAPNGANRQPWRFVVVGDPEIKAQIRAGAEEEEAEFYSGKAPPEWIEALELWAPTSTSRSLSERLGSS